MTLDLFTWQPAGQCVHKLAASRAAWQPAVVEIRNAVATDAEPACRVVRRSITELCFADHRHDPAILQRWLENKTPEVFITWLAQLDHSLLVAVESDAILAVGGVNRAGTITLNYVSPEVRFRGVSRNLLSALEERAADNGHGRFVLDSTVTAHRFYFAAGYVDHGSPVRKFDMTVYPMIKTSAFHNS